MNKMKNPSFIKNMKNIAGESISNEAKIHVKDEFSTYNWIIVRLFEKTRGFN